VRRSPRGRIVDIASTGGVRAVPEFAHHVAARHGVVGPTRAVAIEPPADGSLSGHCLAVDGGALAR
jgi:NAD(P)-dependent dehydrogenase (short-subunit alcohol dehydrogenase family)